LLVTAFGTALIKQSLFLFDLRQDQISKAVYGKNPFDESIPIASYIKAHTDESDKVAVLGSEPQIYFYSNRLSATGHIYMYGLMEEQSYAERMQQEMIDEIESAKPRFVVQVLVPGSWVARPQSSQLVFEWMKSFLKNNFDLVGAADMASNNSTRYLWDRQVAGFSPGSAPTVLLFRRKDATDTPVAP